MNEADGQLHTLSVLEQLREASKSLWGASSEAYFRVDGTGRLCGRPRRGPNFKLFFDSQLRPILRLPKEEFPVLFIIGPSCVPLAFAGVI